MNQPKKMLKLFVIFLIAIVTISIGIFGIYYLKKEKLLFFSTGTDVYAFYNSTWAMSSKEVERNNNCLLELDSGLFSMTLHFAAHPDSKANMLLNENRIIGKKCSNQNVFGYNTDIFYGFFDDKLYKIRIEGKSYDQKEFDSILILNLEKYYGEVQRDSTRDNLKYFSHFKRNQTEVDYWQYLDINDESHFIIDMTYSPIILEINNIAEEEQNSLFR